MATIRSVVFGLCAAAFACSAGAQQVTRIVVSYAAGGPFDSLIRPVAAELSKNGEQFIIENKPGASGIIAAEYVKRAPPDGRTVLVGANSTIVNNSMLFAKLPYDARKDFKPLGLIGYQPNMIVARADLPYTTLPQMVAYAKANPGRINRASVGAGTITNMGGVLFDKAAGIQTTHVPYGGEALVVTALLGGQVDIYAGAISASTVEMVKAGKLRVLGVFDSKRLETLPDVPTVKEFGYDVEAAAWYGLFAPAATPDDVIAKVSRALQEVLSRPDMAARGRANGIETRPTGPDGLAKFVAAEYQRWTPIIESLNLPKQ
jgi:tripartite-type tricarboxylate transporter receptor subunit TctC